MILTTTYTIVDAAQLYIFLRSWLIFEIGMKQFFKFSKINILECPKVLKNALPNRCNYLLYTVNFQQPSLDCIRLKK